MGFELNVSKSGQHGLALKASKQQKLTKQLLYMLVHSVYDDIYNNLFTVLLIRL